MTRTAKRCSIGLGILLAVCLWSLWPDTSPDESFRLGQQALARGDWSAAARHLVKLRQSPTHADQERVLRGGLLLQTGEPRGALRELARVRADSQWQTQAMLLQCEANYQLQQWIAAEQIAVELLRRNSDDAEAHRWLGAIYFDLGATAQTEVHLKELARLRPRDYSPHRLLGLIHKDFERFQEAIGDYQHALKLKPPPDVALAIQLELAKSQIQLHQFSEALQTLDEMGAESNVERRTLAAECLWSLQRKDEARLQLRQAQVSGPNDPNVLWQTARMALDEGRAFEALPPLQQLVTADAFNHQWLYELSKVHRRLGHEAEADQFLERRQVAYDLTRQLVELNQRAINEPTNAALRDELAAVCEQLGKTNLATVWRQAAEALRTTPGGR